MIILLITLFITANSDNFIILQQNSLDRQFCTEHDVINRIVCIIYSPLNKNTHIFENQTLIKSDKQACNTALISSGFDSSRVIGIEACHLLNTLYKENKSAGNTQDIYDNRDGRHVNFCEGWTPNPLCPKENSLFPQHDWQSSSAGRATTPNEAITIGQASYRGEGSHGIAYVYYKNQRNAEQAYNLYTNNNLYIYPSLDDDSFLGEKNSESTLKNPTIDKQKALIANTPYIISSKQISKAGTDTYMIHDASGSEIPFVKLSLTALSALKPEIKSKLSKEVTYKNQRATFLIPTLQMLLRYSHNSIHGNEDYLNSPIVHQSTYMAHSFSSLPQPAYNSLKLVTMANSLNIEDIPPLVQLKVISETFQNSEKLFDTPGAIARSVPYNTPTRKIKVTAKDSFDIQGNTEGFECVWKVLDNSLHVKITISQNNPAEATLEFSPSSITERIDVAVFVKKENGKYYSVPGIISMYVHE